MPEVEEIYCVDLPLSNRLEALSSLPKVRIIEADLSSQLEMLKLPCDVDTVFALAAKNGTSNFYSSPFSVLDNSSSPTINTIKRYAKIAPIVYSSSSETYAATVSDGHAVIPTNEEVRTSIGENKNARWSYAMGKLYGEIALSAACQELGAEGVILRYHNVYGPDMGPGHFVSDFIDRALQGDFSIQGGSSTRSFLYITEAVEATILASNHTSRTPQIYNVGSTEELKILEAARQILILMDLHVGEIKSIPEPVGSVHRRCPDISKIIEEMGWEPQISFHEGIGYYLEAIAES